MTQYLLTYDTDNWKTAPTIDDRLEGTHGVGVLRLSNCWKSDSSSGSTALAPSSSCFNSLCLIRLPLWCDLKLHRSQENLYEGSGVLLLGEGDLGSAFCGDSVSSSSLSNSLVCSSSSSSVPDSSRSSMVDSSCSSPLSRIICSTESGSEVLASSLPLTTWKIKQKLE